ncbi:MAG: hypothetical protein GF375_04185 [Candidatus Omnitrophica bacterium]|nr:hypothetical protein [Candidatus Omnitrophota bacterium]
MRILAVLILFFLLSGCSLYQKSKALMTLKRLGDSQQQMEKYIEEQEKLFDRLVEDIKEDRLKTGLSIEEVNRLYGDPVLKREAPSSQPFSTILLYRYPTRYFDSDRVYLQFDSSGILVGWEYKPHE